jgi:hypothetical protein
MLEHKAPHLELMNIFHGNTPKERVAFRKVVEHPDIHRLAIGGSYNKSLLMSIYDLLMIANTGQKYKQYHMLGVTNYLQVMALMRLAEMGLIGHITSDSSTHIQKAFKKEYLHQAQLTSNIVHLQIGRKHVHPSIGNRLSCSCPVCSRVRYTDIFSMFDGRAINGVLAWHNMYTYNEYVVRMRDVVRLPIKDVAHIMSRQLGSRHGIKEAIDALKFVDMVADVGFEKAAKKYDYFIANTVQHQHGVSLFEGVLSPDSHEYQVRLAESIRIYESGEVPVVGKKDKKSKLRVKRSQSRTAIKGRSGKKKSSKRKKEATK